MRSFLAGLISVYQAVSRFLPPRCRYLPSCSEYMRQALLRHGFFRGLSLGIVRILRCHPWKAGGIDPVPMEIEKKAVSAQPSAGDSHQRSAVREGQQSAVSGQPAESSV